MLATRNLFANVPERLIDEEITILAEFPGARIERIVSTGQASQPGFWYDQEQAEWVVLLSGSAGLLFEGEAAPRTLRPGDYVEIPAHARHRVEWTDANGPTVWLAVHVGAKLDDAGQDGSTPWPAFSKNEFDTFYSSRFGGRDSIPFRP